MDWKMPDLGEGVQEGEIIQWLVKEGDTVIHDQHLVEIMTDKATMEIPSPIEGVVQKIVVKEGAIAKIGQTLAVIGKEGERRTEIRRHGDTETGKTEMRKTEIGERPRPMVSAGKELASPAVRALAREKGIDLPAVPGSGPGGRILKTDLERIARGSTLRQDQGSARTGDITARPEPVEGRAIAAENAERIPLRGLRRKIAEHMVLSRRTAAHFTHVDEADFTELVAAREKSRKEAQAKGVKLTYLPFIMKAVIQGLKKFPTMNASLDDAAHEIVVKKDYNLGVAVATEEGLIVPVVRHADKLNLFELAREITRLGEAARTHKIALEDLKGGTFTLTNIGSIGGLFSAPVINYPEVAIMGLHKIRPTPVVVDGQIMVRQIMYISISADHRVVDGAYVAAFLNEVIRCLSHPGELL